MSDWQPIETHEPPHETLPCCFHDPALIAAASFSAVTSGANLTSSHTKSHVRTRRG